MSLFKDSFSEDEIFVGEVTLPEIKKVLSKPRQTITCTTTSQSQGNQDRSIKIIETHSEPCLLPHKNTQDCLPISKTLSSVRSLSSLSPDTEKRRSWDLKDVDDSFLKMEAMVTKLCVSSKNNSIEELNNTFEVVNYILNHKSEFSNDNFNEADIEASKETTDKVNMIKVSSPSKSLKEIVSGIDKEKDKQHCIENTNDVPSTHSPISSAYKTPIKSENKVVKPHHEVKHSTLVFKTPAQPSQKKFTPISKSGYKNQYNYISSPVASYIKKSPQVPLIKDVRPRKPLPGISSIPKPLKSTSKFANKENVNLPTIAYKSAKKTKVIEVPNVNKLPCSPWAKKVTSSLPKPMVMKHDHRETKSVKNSLKHHQEENSFADLTLHQAEVSICTQKSAYKEP